MRQLSDAIISGEAAAVASIRALFGGIKFSSVDFGGQHKSGIATRLTLMAVLPNVYRKSDATVSEEPLYILVPDLTIHSVWPDGDYDDIRFGTAITESGKFITRALCFHKGTTGLYLCLTPTIEKIKIWGSLGI